MRLVYLDEIPDEGVSHDPHLLKRVMIRDGEIPHLKKFAKLFMRPGQVAHAHYHSNEYEVFLIESGDCTVAVGENRFSAGPGTCIVFEPGEVHEVINSGAIDLVLTYFGIEVPSQS